MLNDIFVCLVTLLLCKGNSAFQSSQSSWAHAAITPLPGGFMRVDNGLQTD